MLDLHTGLPAHGELCSWLTGHAVQVRVQLPEAIAGDLFHTRPLEEEAGTGNMR